MKVHIEGNLFLESDLHNFIIKEYLPRKEGKASGKVVVLGYFSNFHSAIKYLVKLKLKQSTATNLLELSRDLKQIEEYIHSQVRV